MKSASPTHSFVSPMYRSFIGGLCLFILPAVPGCSFDEEFVDVVYSSGALTGQGDVPVHIRKDASNFLLNLHNNYNGNGGTVNLWGTNGNISQDWVWRAEDNTIRSQGNLDFCLNLHYDWNGSGGIVNLWNCNGHNSQKWSIEDDGTIRKLNNPGFCLNLHYDYHGYGALVNLWSCNGHNSQQWQVESTAPICGDGVVAGAEQCDDGNVLADDGCSAACFVETYRTTPLLGGDFVDGAKVAIRTRRVIDHTGAVIPWRKWVGVDNHKVVVVEDTLTDVSVFEIEAFRQSNGHIWYNLKAADGTYLGYDRRSWVLAAGWGRDSASIFVRDNAYPTLFTVLGMTNSSGGAYSWYYRLDASQSGQRTDTNQRFSYKTPWPNVYSGWLLNDWRASDMDFVLVTDN